MRFSPFEREDEVASNDVHQIFLTHFPGICWQIFEKQDIAQYNSFKILIFSRVLESLAKDLQFMQIRGY